MPRFAPGPYSRAGRPRTSEKTAFRVIPGPSPQGHPSLDGTPAEGRALHARDEGTTLIQMLSPFGHWLIVKAPVATPWLAIRPAVRCGRAERVPPRKTPFAYFRAFPRKAVSPRSVHPAEGRALHARKGGIGLAQTCPR
jgi:hypothetical protein